MSISPPVTLRNLTSVTLRSASPPSPCGAYLATPSFRAKSRNPESTVTQLWSLDPATSRRETGEGKHRETGERNCREMGERNCRETEVGLSTHSGGECS